MMLLSTLCLHNRIDINYIFRHLVHVQLTGDCRSPGIRGTYFSLLLGVMYITLIIIIIILVIEKQSVPIHQAVK